MDRRRRLFASSERGQALVEFVLILPVLLLLIFGVIEFGFAFNAAASVNLVSQTAGTDCMVLRAIERDITSPATPTRISTVEIYWSDPNGDQIGSNVNLYTRTGSLTCSYASGSITVPYTLTTARYPEDQRCDVLAGCGGPHTTVDDIGVRITYSHQWATRFGQTIAGSITFQRSTAVRMEPTL